MSYEHKPVLLTQAIEGLAIKEDGIYIDATFGRGGHSAAILEALGANGRLIAIDKDPAAIARAKIAPFDDPRFSIVHASFAELAEIIAKRGLTGKVDGILMDLGVSSPQLEDPERGFSFTREGPLDMRMNPQTGMDAATWINTAEQHEIAKVLRVYGEERFAGRISRAIVQVRENKKFTTTKELAEVIANASRSRENKHPATRSFQAIRIFINQELDDLKKALAQCLDVLSVHGRISVISFHSLEDRIVKRFIQQQALGESYPPRLPLKEEQIKRRLRKIGGLIRPTATEVNANVRARSARLRIAEKLA